jgi:hypothetical protein
MTKRALTSSVLIKHETESQTKGPQVSSRRSKAKAASPQNHRSSAGEPTVPTAATTYLDASPALCRDDTSEGRPASGNPAAVFRARPKRRR